MTFVEKLLALHRHLDDGGIPHAFGGALALAWCVEQARGTQDIDVNLFVGVSEFERALRALPGGVSIVEENRRQLERDGQTRLWWGDVPVDVFLNTTAFHEAVARRVRWDELAGADLPFLDCDDLAVFKAFFNRTKDWIDLAVMLHDGTLDRDRLIRTLSDYLGAEDERVARARELEPVAWS